MLTPIPATIQSRTILNSFSKSVLNRILFEPQSPEDQVWERKAVASARDNLLVRIGDLNAPARSVTNHVRVRVVRLPAPHVEPIESGSEGLPPFLAGLNFLRQ